MKPSDLQVAARYWNEYTNQYFEQYRGIFWWEAGPAIAESINEKISGNPRMGWEEYTLQTHFSNQVPLEKCLVLGCGAGHLERVLAGLRGFLFCDAYDIAEVAIQKARELAEKHKIENVNYYISDINTLLLPKMHYDAVWINNALHHFHALEHILYEIRKCLKQNGLLILKEYIGPNRFQFPDRQKELASYCLALLPKRYRKKVPESIRAELRRNPFQKGLKWFLVRLVAKVKEGDLIGVIRRRVRLFLATHNNQEIEKVSLDFPTTSDVVQVDPTEAIRSEDILPVLQQHFEIIENKSLGGNILQFLLADIAGNFSADDIVSQKLLGMLFNIENTLLLAGEFQSDFAYIVARPKPLNPK